MSFAQNKKTSKKLYSAMAECYKPIHHLTHKHKSKMLAFYNVRWAWMGRLKERERITYQIHLKMFIVICAAINVLEPPCLFVFDHRILFSSSCIVGFSFGQLHPFSMPTYVQEFSVFF